MNTAPTPVLFRIECPKQPGPEYRFFVWSRHLPTGCEGIRGGGYLTMELATVQAERLAPGHFWRIYELPDEKEEP